MVIIDRDDVLRVLDEKSCITVMDDALTGLETGRGEQYLRSAIMLPGDNVFAFMPAWLDESMFGTKVLTVFHGNGAAGCPSHQGMVLLFEANHGSLVAMVDAAAITRVRTGAVSALATRLLSRKDARHLALMGCGVQAESHLRAIRHVRALETVAVWDIDPVRGAAFARCMAGETGLPVLYRETAEEAVRGADIICTLTPSQTPILESGWVADGAHINAVGACLPKDREIPSALMRRARVFGDSEESVLKESGDFLIPMQEGLYGREHLLGNIGALALGKIEGRQNDSQVTLFEALGLAIEDIAAARFVYESHQK